MTDLPLVVILLLTYLDEAKPERVNYAIRAIRQTKENLIYPNLKWYVADASESEKNFKFIMDEIGMDNLQGGHSKKQSPGENWNVGIRNAFSNSDIYLRLEDDWVPQRPIDITEYVKMLQFREDIGMVRLGYQHVPADMEAIGIEGIHYLRYKKTTPFAYGGHPALIHRRFHDAYGYNNEEKNPGDIEIDMDYRVRNTEGPGIVRPDYMGYGAFAHIGEKKGY